MVELKQLIILESDLIYQKYTRSLLHNKTKHDKNKRLEKYRYIFEDEFFR